MNIRKLSDLDVRNRRVLLRVDFNVPLDGSGRITDDTRIRASLPTLRHILDRGGCLVLLTHLGRPKGIIENLRLKPVADRLSSLLGQRVRYVPETLGPIARQEAAALQRGECLLLENLRFHDGEALNDMEFAKGLADLGDLYVNDAFGTAHRAHASTEGVAQLLPERAAGLLMEQELKFLASAIERPKGRFAVVLGGAKVSDKIGIARRLVDSADSLIIGGGMAYTFLASRGIAVGSSLVEEDRLGFARELQQWAEDLGKPLLLPIDHVVAAKLDPTATARQVDLIPKGTRGLDIGEATRSRFVAAIEKAGTILWNGPMGVFEMQPFAAGTNEIALAIANATDRGAVSIVGGGDSMAAIHNLGLEGRMTHLSTGGGATLALLEGQTLPGVKVLTAG